MADNGTGNGVSTRGHLEQQAREAIAQIGRDFGASSVLVVFGTEAGASMFCAVKDDGPVGMIAQVVDLIIRGIASMPAAAQPASPSAIVNPHTGRPVS